MTIKKLSSMPYAQAHIEIDDNNNIYLFSYYTLVACWDHEGWLTIFGLYSMTTRKHISAFLKEYVKLYDGEPVSFQTAKKMYEDGYSFNTETGEVVDA